MFDAEFDFEQTLAEHEDLWEEQFKVTKKITEKGSGSIPFDDEGLGDVGLSTPPSLVMADHTSSAATGRCDAGEPAAKRRRITSKRCDSSSPSGSSAQSSSSPSSLPALPFRRTDGYSKAVAEPLAASVEECGDTQDIAESFEDRRSGQQKQDDYNVSINAARRVHYHESAEKYPKLSGQKRKLAIRQEFSNLDFKTKIKFCERAVREQNAEPGEKSALQRYLRWTREGEKEDNAEGKRARQRFINGKIAFLTYHADAWVLSRPAWNLQEAAEPLAAAVQRCRSDATVTALKSRLSEDIEVVRTEQNVKEWSLALELCPDSLRKDKALRLHVHVVMSWGKQKSIAFASAFRLAGVLPTHNTATPMAFHRSRSTAPAHYYLQMPKVGGIWSATNTPAFKNFPVNPRWVTAFWQAGQLVTATARAEYVKCKMNLVSNLQNLQVVDRETEAELLDKHMDVVNKALNADLVQFRHVPEREEFLEQIKQIRRRYKFLVVWGESCTGKTVWAKYLFGDAGKVLEVNCASCPEPDLREFRPLQHKGILFDEAPAEMVLRQKKLFQSPASKCRLGCSVTNCHAYDVYVSGVAMMIASNTWDSELKELKRDEDRAWLKANSIVVKVGTQPLFIEEAA